jgi:hypothetical protein
VWVAPANAATHVSGYISSDTTWTQAAGPYVVDNGVTVQASAILTIEPGTIVKFSSSNTQLMIQGVLTAIGNPGNEIVFTSLQDDSVGGDTGGDGLTVGAPGQWYSVNVSGSATIWHADFRFGGNGSVDNAYGALSVSGGTVDVDYCTFEQNKRSGIAFGAGSTGVVDHSILTLNGNGVSAYNTALTLRNTTIEDNSNTGVFLNYLYSYTGAPATVTASDIRNNTAFGIVLQVYSTVAQSSQPYGHGNNIGGNGGGLFQRQLYTLYSLPLSDWTGNYWGQQVFPIYCPWAPTSTTVYHLGYQDQPDLSKHPSPGPVNFVEWSLYVSGKWYYCGTDLVKNYQPSQTEFPR